MKTAWTLAVALAVLAAGGCERPDEPRRTSEYDPAIDGPPPVYAPSGDPNLLADQKKLAQEAAAKARAAVPAPPGPLPPGPSAGPARAQLPPGTDPVESARQALQGAASALAAGRQQQAMDLMGGEVAGLLQQNASLPELLAKTKALEQLVRQKFGDAAGAKFAGLSLIEGPAPAPGQDLEQMLKQLEPQALLGKFLDVAKLTLKAEGDDVVGTQTDGPSFRMVHTAQGWKIETDPAMRDLLTTTAELLAAVGKAADAMTAGINDGSVNQANLDARVQAAGQQLKPLDDKFRAAWPKAGIAGAPGAPAPGPPAAPTPGPPPVEPTTAPGPPLPEF